MDYFLRKTDEGSYLGKSDLRDNEAECRPAQSKFDRTCAATLPCRSFQQHLITQFILYLVIFWVALLSTFLLIASLTMLILTMSSLPVIAQPFCDPPSFPSTNRTTLRPEQGGRRGGRGGRRRGELDWQGLTRKGDLDQPPWLRPRFPYADVPRRRNRPEPEVTEPPVVDLDLFFTIELPVTTTTTTVKKKPRKMTTIEAQGPRLAPRKFPKTKKSERPTEKKTKKRRKSTTKKLVPKVQVKTLTTSKKTTTTTPSSKKTTTTIFKKTTTLSFKKTSPPPLVELLPVTTLTPRTEKPPERAKPTWIHLPMFPIEKPTEEDDDRKRKRHVNEGILNVESTLPVTKFLSYGNEDNYPVDKILSQFEKDLFDASKEKIYAPGQWVVRNESKMMWLRKEIGKNYVPNARVLWNKDNTSMWLDDDLSFASKKKRKKSRLGFLLAMRRIYGQRRNVTNYRNESFAGRHQFL